MFPTAVADGNGWRRRRFVTQAPVRNLTSHSISIGGGGMVTALRGFFASAAAVALLPLCLAAQQPAVITGKVTGEGGRPVANASVSIQQLGIGANTREDGTYTILVPAARVTGGQVGL